MSEIKCETTAEGGRSGVRPCPGSWCGIDDANAWIASSRVVTSYALEVAEWLAANGANQLGVALLVARLELEKRVSSLSSLVSQWGLLIMARTDLDKDIAGLVAAQDDVCRAIAAASNAMGDGWSDAPVEPKRWKEIEEKAAADAAWYKEVFPEWFTGAGAAGVAVAVVIVAAVVLALASSRGRRRR